MIINYGFIPDKIQPEDYVFGGFGIPKKEPLNKLADWRNFYPSEESQRNNTLDSFGCTLFGTFNCIEVLAKFLFNKQWDKAERFTGAFAGMKPLGNTPHKVAEAIRKVGMIPEELMPFSEDVKSFENLWNKKEAKKFLNKGKKWRKTYKFKHDWVFGDWREALTYSPLGVSVHAWVQDKNGLYYKPEGAKDTHWAMIGFEQKDGYEKENYVEIFDSYAPYIKRLRPGYKFGFVKRWSLEERLKVSFWEWLALIIFKSR